MFNKHIIAIRIYLGGHDGATPMADLKAVDGTKRTIQWTNIEQRERFAPMINGYTLFYDERPKRKWNEWK